jgi:hypothetical protein
MRIMEEVLLQDIGRIGDELSAACVKGILLKPRMYGLSLSLLGHKQAPRVVTT